MFPLSDDRSRMAVTPIATWSLMGACFLVFLWESSLGAKAGEIALYHYGMIPARLLGLAKFRTHVAIPASATLLTSMFLHGGWLHLGLNMLFLWVFGGKVEDSMGHSRFLMFYLLCGVAAAVAQAIMNPGSTLPMVGASGAISGVLGAYFFLHPLSNIRVLFFLGFIPIVAQVPALIFLGLWFAVQIASATFSVLSEPGVAVWAHVGGFLTGMLLTPLLRQNTVKLLQPRYSRAFQIERGQGPWSM
jgi:membrane associated rhomboid family serine protease